jgi:hypothetical protein
MQLAHKRAIENGDEIMMAYDVKFSDGEIGPCYVLINTHAGRCCATTVSIKRAIELQEIGYPFNGSHPIYAGDVDTFFAPDFPSLGGSTMRAFTERTPESITG